MLRRFLESSVLFIHIIRWFFIAVVVGVLVGVSTTYFLKALDGSIALAGRWPWTFLLLPIAFPVSAYLVRRFAPEAEGHGTEKVIEAYHRQSGASARSSAAAGCRPGFRRMISRDHKYSSSLQQSASSDQSSARREEGLSEDAFNATGIIHL